MHWLQEKELRTKIKEALTVTVSPNERDYLLLLLDRLLSAYNSAADHAQKTKELVEEIAGYTEELRSSRNLVDIRDISTVLNSCVRALTLHINRML